MVQWGMVNACALFGMILPSGHYQSMAAIAGGALSAACMVFNFPGILRAFASGLELADYEKDMQRDSTDLPSK